MAVVGVGRDKHSKLHFPCDSMRECSMGRLLLWGGRERKKNSALDITQHNNGTAAHYFQRLVAAEQLSTELRGRSRWKAPHGAASGNNGDLHAARWGSFQPYGAQQSHIVFKKMFKWWERRTIFRRRQRANQEELNNTLPKAKLS